MTALTLRPRGRVTFKDSATTIVPMITGEVSPWQRRIARAECLSNKHPFAAEILSFYVRVARFQQDLYRKLELASDHKIVVASGTVASAGFGPPELPLLLSSFAPFLSMV